MNLLVIGGSKGIGGHAVAMALTHQHRVTLLDRGADDFLLAANPEFTGVVADVQETDKLVSAMAGQDAVLVCIGARSGAGEARRLETATAAVIAAMKQEHVHRLVAVTGIGAVETLQATGFWFRRVLTPLLYQPLFAERIRQEELIRESGLDWTVLRPTYLAPGPRSGRVLASTDFTSVRATPVSRADVAEVAIQELETGHWCGKSPLLFVTSQSS